MSTIIAGLQWTVSNRVRFGIRVVNLSYGTDGIRRPIGTRSTSPSSRRGARDSWSWSRPATAPAPISKPGDDPFVITVGAADVNGTATVADDTVAGFSSRGGGKPDLVAPGVSLVSLRAPGSAIDVFNPAARLGAAYFKGSGTSQAAAVVSGVAARIIDSNLSLTPDQAKGSLVAAADDELAGDGAGAGLLDAAGAISRANPEKSGKGSGGSIPRANAA